MRVLVADQNAVLLAAISATFGQHCDLVTATRRDACLEEAERQRFDVVVAGDKLGDYTGLELLSEIAGLYPETLLIFAASPTRLKRLGGRLELFGLLDTISYPLTPRKLLDVLKLARRVLRPRSARKVRHVVLESEWDTGERLALVERELETDAPGPGRHEGWQAQHPSGDESSDAAEELTEDEATEPSGAQTHSPAHEPHATAHPAHAQAHSAHAVGHTGRATAHTSRADGHSGRPVVHTRQADRHSGGPVVHRRQADEHTAHDAASGTAHPNAHAAHAAASGTAHPNAHAAHAAASGTAHPNAHTAHAAASGTAHLAAHPAHAAADAGRAGRHIAQGAVRTAAHPVAGTTHTAARPAAPALPERISHGTRAAGAVDEFVFAPAPKAAASSDMASKALVELPQSGVPIVRAVRARVSRAVVVSNDPVFDKPPVAEEPPIEVDQPAEPEYVEDGAANDSTFESKSTRSETNKGKTALSEPPRTESATASRNAEKRPKVRTPAQPTAAQLAVFERALARRNADRAADAAERGRGAVSNRRGGKKLDVQSALARGGSFVSEIGSMFAGRRGGSSADAPPDFDDAPVDLGADLGGMSASDTTVHPTANTNRRAGTGANTRGAAGKIGTTVKPPGSTRTRVGTAANSRGAGARAQDNSHGATANAHGITANDPNAGAKPPGSPQSLSQLARMAATKRPLADLKPNRGLQSSKRSVFWVGSGLVAVLLIGAFTFEQLRTPARAEHMAQTQAAPAPFASGGTTVGGGGGMPAQIFSPPPPQAAASAANLPQLQNLDPATAPPDPPPPPALEHPGPIEPPSAMHSGPPLGMVPSNGDPDTDDVDSAKGWNQ
jgi:CheY-like chemotaxis protein